VNRAACRLYGYSQAEFRGKPLSQIHGAGATDVPLPLFRDRTMVDLTGSAVHRRKDGAAIEVEMLAHRIQMLDMPAWLLVIQDVTARRQAEQLRVQLAASEKASRLKDLMVNTVSHELRNPLTGVRGNLSAVLEYWDRLSPAEIKEMVLAADRSAEQAQLLLNDILTLSNAESDALALNFTRVDLPAFVRQLLDSEREANPAHQYRLFGPDTGEADCDTRSLELILHNLFQNAQKYSPPGSPIQVSLDFEPDTVAISVRDFGPGVPQDDLELIFEPFYRKGTAHRSAAGGTGLGLAICRALAQAHGGSIRAANAGDGGLVVTVRLPRTQPAARA